MELGASPVVAIEPDERLAAFLTTTLAPNASLDVRVTTFEHADLPPEWFDLGTSASAFHWLDEIASLSKVARILRGGGWWAVWWNLFFDGSRTDEFHDATRILFEDLERSPSHGLDGRPSFALDIEARIANLRAVGVFEDVEVDIIPWTVVLDTLRTMRLYATFSPISRLTPDEREGRLNRLGQIADKEFGGQVELKITTPIYTAQRRSRNSG